MNYFIEGLQGSGKSTLLQKLSKRRGDYTVIREGDYSPVELAWCARVNGAEYQEILAKYSDIRSRIEEKTVSEGESKIICYTRVATDIPGFYKELGQFEIYHGLVSYDAFKSIVLSRFEKWNQDKNLFECSLFQNIVEDMILFRQATDEEIIAFYHLVRRALEGKGVHIVYLKTEDIRSSLDAVRKERSDDQGNELWFSMLRAYFNESPYAKAHALADEDGIITHLAHRQALELRICEELFPGETTILISKEYTDDDIARLPG